MLVFNKLFRAYYVRFLHGNSPLNLDIHLGPCGATRGFSQMVPTFPEREGTNLQH